MLRSIFILLNAHSPALYLCSNLQWTNPSDKSRHGVSVQVKCLQCLGSSADLANSFSHLVNAGANVLSSFSGFSTHQKSHRNNLIKQIRSECICE